MMAKLRIIQANLVIDVNHVVTNVRITSPTVFRELVFNFEKEIMLFENNEEIDIINNVILIKSPLSISLNDKIIINALYKRIENSLSDNQKQKFTEIESNFVQLIEELLMEYPLSFNYNDTIDFNKILSLYKITIDEERSTYIEKIVNYLKLLNEIKNYKYIIAFDLLKYLNKEELEQLTKELPLLELKLINFSFDTTYNDNQLTISIDDDWCVF